jgi:helicase
MPPVKKLEDQNALVPTKNFPKYASFPFENFNPVQSRIFEIYDKDVNAIIAAATAAGKTVCAEQFMSHEVRKRGGKALYLVPLRALAKEKIDDWTDKKHHFGDLNLSICTGDYRLTAARKKELEAADIIIMTSEMLSSRCRNYESEQNHFLKEIGTIVCDESHLLTVPGRGDHLEVGLMKFTEISPDCRVVFLSATMPNVEQISEWVSYVLTGKETYLINSTYRPCPLGLHWEKYENAWRYEKNEENKIEAACRIIDDHPDDKFLVFVHTKRTGEKMKKAIQEMGIKCEYHNADLEKGKRHEVENRFKKDKSLRVIVATSTLAWGINTSARRVIIVGVHRGLNEVESYDILQMAGRAGRPGFDPRGDVYILLPDKDKEFDRHFDRLAQSQDIESRLLDYSGNENKRHYKTLAFHIVSEIYRGEIKTSEDVHKWFERSLAHFQSQELDDSIVDDTIELLKMFGAIKEQNGEYEVTGVGKVASLFYYSPFDVADLRRNFKFVFENGFENSDLAVAMALGNVDEIKMGFVSKAEDQEMASFSRQVVNNFGEGTFWQQAIKGGYAHFTLMNGLSPGPFAAMVRGLQLDFPRTAAVLHGIDSMSCRWGKKKFFDNLSLRIAYGVRTELIELCKLPNIGKVRAEKLYAAGFRTADDVIDRPEHVQKVINMKKDRVDEIVKAAKAARLTK